MENKILVYGAAGYMGQLFLKIVQNFELDIVLGARDSFSSKYPVRVFSLEHKPEIIENLIDIKLLINLAGPFKNTNIALINACIVTGTHYIDIAGEAPELEAVFKYNELAKKANIMLLPGAGFGVAPTDIVANLAKQKISDATHLKIAYVTIGGASRGTLKTVLADINKEGVILENGIYKKAMPAFKTFSFISGMKKYKLVYNPWRADLFSAKISTGIQNIETYANFPGFIVSMMHGKLLWLRDFMLKRIINFLPLGPSDKQISKGSTICFAEVSNAKGEKATSILEGPEAYQFTAEILLKITQNILMDNLKVGFQTPNIYGAALINSISNVKII